jgi:hypothetical protein
MSALDYRGSFSMSRLAGPIPTANFAISFNRQYPTDDRLDLS